MAVRKQTEEYAPTLDLAVAEQTAAPTTVVLRDDGGASLMQVIARAASDERVDVAKMSALLDMQERIMAKQAEMEFNRAFSDASMEMPRILKNGVIEMGSKGSIAFAKYEDLDKVIRPIEAKYGFTRSFTTKTSATPGIEMTVKLAHRAGHAEFSTRHMPPDPGPGRNAMQAIGSSGSYAKRYLTKDIWNLVTVGEDDDAKSSGLISEDQANTLLDLMHECGMDADTDAARESKRRFLAFAEVDRIENLPAGAYKMAFNQLRSKGRK